MTPEAKPIFPNKAPKDFMKSSQKIGAWLKAQGITFEVDEFAPVIWSGDMGQLLVSTRHDAINAIYKINEERGEFDCEGKIICPFFGPGGADNSLKALTAWCEKKGYVLERPTYYKYIAWAIWHRRVCLFICKGKTDGIALHDLLEKLMEEKK